MKKIIGKRVRFNRRNTFTSIIVIFFTVLSGIQAAQAATVPNVPTGVIATPGNGSLSVSFTVGLDGGSAITGYKYSIDSGASFTSVAVGVNPIVVTGLTNGTSYGTLVEVSNALGDSAPSTLVSGTPTVTAPEVPAAFSINPGDANLSIVFTPGLDGGSAITDYKYSLDNGVTFVSAGITVSPIFVTGLTNGVSYPVQFRAVNAIGDGTVTPVVTVTPVPPAPFGPPSFGPPFFGPPILPPILPPPPPPILPPPPPVPASTIPQAPSSLTLTPSDSTLSIAYVPGLDGGSAIVDYKYSIDGGTTFISSGTTSPPILIAGLTNGITYSVQLKASNIVGDSLATSTVSGTPLAPLPPASIPDAPTGVTVTPGDTTLSILFNPGLDGGSAITDYKYSINGGLSFQSAGTILNHFVITGLTNGASYSVEIKETNIVGSSLPTSMIFGTPMAPAPTIIGVSPASGTSVGGTLITISGTGFTTGASVSIGGVLAGTVTVVTSTSITAVTNLGGAGVKDITVTNPDAQVFLGHSLYTYLAPIVLAPVVLVPVVVRPAIQADSISGINPSVGSTINSTPVTIQGFFPSPVTGIQINGLFLPSSEWTQDSSTIKFILPPHLPLNTIISIFNGQAPLLPDQFLTFLDPPPTPTPTPTPSPSPSPSPSSTPTPTPTPSAMPSAMPSPTPIAMPSPTPTPTPRSTPTPSAMPSPTPTPSRKPVQVPLVAPTITASPLPDVTSLETTPTIPTTPVLRPDIPAPTPATPTTIAPLLTLTVSPSLTIFLNLSISTKADTTNNKFALDFNFSSITNILATRIKVTLREIQE